MERKPIPPDVADIAQRTVTAAYQPTREEIEAMATAVIDQLPPPPETSPGPDDIVTVKVTKDGVQRSIDYGAAIGHPDKVPVDPERIR
jgi:hypothetical protein